MKQHPRYRYRETLHMDLREAFSKVTEHYPDAFPSEVHHALTRILVRSLNAACSDDGEQWLRDEIHGNQHPLPQPETFEDEGEMITCNPDLQDYIEAFYKSGRLLANRRLPDLKSHT